MTAVVSSTCMLVRADHLQENRRAYRDLFVSATDPAHIGGIIFFKETLLQSSHTGKSFVEVLNSKGVLPGIKVDEASP